MDGVRLMRLFGIAGSCLPPSSQPSNEIFSLATKVILVTAGRVAYCGPSDEVVSYFTSPLLGYTAPIHANPADFIIAVVSGAEVSSTSLG